MQRGAEMSFEKKLESLILEYVSEWKDTDIYAISFLLTFNQSSNYKGIENFPEFSVGYNTENDCGYADMLSEERWNFACWCQNNAVIIDADHTEIADELIEWYNEQGIVDIGLESEDEMYNENGDYIGKGPNGYWELLSLISNIAKRIQINGDVKSRLGNIPIIVHNLEYSWYVSIVTENANPNGEAKVFLDYLRNISSDN